MTQPDPEYSPSRDEQPDFMSLVLLSCKNVQRLKAEKRRVEMQTQAGHVNTQQEAKDGFRKYKQQGINLMFPLI